MGGLFRAPKPVVIPPPPPPELLPAPAAAEQARVAAHSRAARGRAGTILTSERGVVDGLPRDLPRKSLLGE